ncbi:hypothetical protein [Streptomyces sp. NPDC086787]|uniref:hypothetical protein n=1 Tax=Streptomyces sp. NPDC086787 TaxID=3365759 RepID=UPI0038227852
MRLSHSLAVLTVSVALVLSLPFEALSHPRVRRGEDPSAPSLFGAECRTTVSGSEVVAYCHNPYVDTDRVSLHIECARWWDLDTDGDAVDTGPATTVRLSGRCWKEVGSAWISHEKAAG